MFASPERSNDRTNESAVQISQSEIKAAQVPENKLTLAGIVLRTSAKTHDTSIYARTRYVFFRLFVK